MNLVYDFFERVDIFDRIGLPQGFWLAHDFPNLLIFVRSAALAPRVSFYQSVRRVKLSGARLSFLK